MSSPTILVYSNRLLPLSETFIRNQAEALTTFAPHYVGCRRVNGLSLPEDRVEVVNEGSWKGWLQEGRFKLFGPSRDFIKRLQALRPALLHAHFGPCAAIALPLADTLNLPLVVTYHGKDASLPDSHLRRQPQLTIQVYLRRRRYLKERANQFLVMTNYMRELLTRKGFPEEKITVLPLGIDTTFFKPDPEIEREPVVLFVGRLVEKKGATYLIEAMAAVQRSLPDVRLVIIGDGPLRQSLEQQARDTLQRYTFLGKQPAEVVRERLNRARVFCVPSVIASSGDVEGLGVVFLEAQSMGTPVVATNSGGIPEAVEDGRTGFLVPERDSEAIAQRLLLLMTDAACWHAMHEAGQTRIRRAYNIRKQTKALEALYTMLIHNSPF